jgi:hypothetical protein
MFLCPQRTGGAFFFLMVFFGTTQRTAGAFFFLFWYHTTHLRWCVVLFLALGTPSCILHSVVLVCTRSWLSAHVPRAKAYVRRASRDKLLIAHVAFTAAADCGFNQLVCSARRAQTAPVLCLTCACTCLGLDTSTTNVHTLCTELGALVTCKPHTYDACMSVYVLCVYVLCVCVYIYIYIHTHSHKYTHTHSVTLK